jgi:hypothetical protein
MTDWAGKFVDPAVAETEAHQRAQTDEEKKAHTLPKTVTYEVSRDLCQEIRASRRKTAKSSSGKGADSSSEQDSTSQEDSSRFVAPSVGVCTLARPVAASVTYMDVGCWGGSAPKDRNTKDHWKKQRFFGIVYERLAVLCAYKPWPTEALPRSWMRQRRFPRTSTFKATSSTEDPPPPRSPLDRPRSRAGGRVASRSERPDRRGIAARRPDSRHPRRSSCAGHDRAGSDLRGTPASPAAFRRRNRTIEKHGHVNGTPAWPARTTISWGRDWTIEKHGHIDGRGHLNREQRREHGAD